MPHYYAVIQHGKNDTTRKIHRIAVPTFAEDGFYRQTGTLNAFFHGSKDRNNFFALHPKTAVALGRKPRKSTHKFWYYGVRWEEFEESATRWERLGGSGNDLKLPRTEHDSMWAFYEHIGFDYKTGKYV